MKKRTKKRKREDERVGIQTNNNKKTLKKKTGTNRRRQYNKYVEKGCSQNVIMYFGCHLSAQRKWESYTKDGSEDIIHNKLRNLFLPNFVERKAGHFTIDRDDIMITFTTRIHTHLHAYMKWFIFLFYIVLLCFCAILIENREPPAKRSSTVIKAKWIRTLQTQHFFCAMVCVPSQFIAFHRNWTVKMAKWRHLYDVQMWISYRTICTFFFIVTNVHIW